MYNFIYNPIAGKGRAQRFRAEIEPQLKARGVSFRFWETTAPRDAVRIAEELTVRGETDIVVMGGDGTVNEVLNGLDDPSKVRLGLIPCGSGNDFAAAIGIPRTPEGSLDKILNGEAHEGFIVCACNGRRIGGGIPICPKAICDDGKLDIVIVDGIKKRMIPGALIKLLKSKILEQKYTIHTLAPELKAKFSRPTTIQIDGELYDDLPFDVRIVHDQLRVYR